MRPASPWFLPYPLYPPSVPTAATGHPLREVARCGGIATPLPAGLAGFACRTRAFVAGVRLRDRAPPSHGNVQRAENARIGRAERPPRSARGAPWQVEYECLGRVPGRDGEDTFLRHGRTIALVEDGVADADPAARNLHPRRPTGGDPDLRGAARPRAGRHGPWRPGTDARPPPAARRWRQPGRLRTGQAAARSAAEARSAPAVSRSEGIGPRRTGTG